jgi:maltooligosyltrehalose trehalohydrolase
MSKFYRRLPAGAEPQPGGGVHFRVWAPNRKTVEVLVEPQGVRRTLDREPGDDGYFSGLVPEAAAGSRYVYALDGEEARYPDPVSRFQPEGVHGPSEVIDPAAYRWNDAGRKGLSLPGQVLYEMHFGTFTPEGTYLAAIDKLPLLKEVGITAVEVMPVAEYGGTYGWGYDGVDLFAPTHNHGRPDDLRRFVDAAHGLGIGVILDVVYNHFGPAGNYVGVFSDHYLSAKHMTDWGAGVNYDDAGCGPVREFVASNAAYWIDEFHFDGLRLDAVQAIVDDSPEHILKTLTRRAREAAKGRSIIVIAEDEWQRTKFFTPVERGGHGLDGSWNDDFHHTCRVAATGHAEHYYSEYRGGPQELISVAKRGYLYQGQWNSRQKKFRGSPTRGLPARSFVNFLQNHDQVANTPTARRLCTQTSPGRYRALATFWLLAPGTPLFFQGQEFNATAPFHYFVDHPADLAKLVREGRWASMREFGRVQGSERVRPQIDPTVRSTFEECALDWSERDRHPEAVALHRDLLRLRREDPVFAAQDADATEGAVIGPEALLLRYYGQSGDDRLLLLNLGRDMTFDTAAEPLLAAPPGADWTTLFSSDDPRYGGAGTPPLETKDWFIPGHAALVLRPEPDREHPPES